MRAPAGLAWASGTARTAPEEALLAVSHWLSARTHVSVARPAGAGKLQEPLGGAAFIQKRCRRRLASITLGVEIEGELPRMGPQPDGVHLVLALVIDPGVDEVLREDVALS